MKSKTAILLIVILFGAMVIIYTIRHQQVSTARVGLPAPDIKLTDSFYKNELKLSDLRGNVIFVNFWATWCPPCIDELPSIQRLTKKFEGNPNLRIITILYNDDINRVNYYMKEMNYTFPIYIDSNRSAADKFGITGVPETFIIDKKGILRNKVIGPSEWDSPHVIELLSKLLNE